MTAIAAVVLAAGKGSRMGSELHKVLHPLRGKPMLGHLLDSLARVDAQQVVLVVGAGREQIEQAYPALPNCAASRAPCSFSMATCR
ncbi:MAG: hypothetical protein DI549_15870 [Ancylobacter novellus]|uniref:MobA-like NTP transferase domain-containing protein n=1 Tax=Ancylobacter novellus TaxID=921 RepID=A0A2W5QUK3_ANCNO|nr:MAG: hypothetical protein DI549_15870 [Ancylobacter novellus]